MHLSSSPHLHQRGGGFSYHISGSTVHNPRTHSLWPHVSYVYMYTPVCVKSSNATFPHRYFNSFLYVRPFACVHVTSYNNYTCCLDRKGDRTNCTRSIIFEFSLVLIRSCFPFVTLGMIYPFLFSYFLPICARPFFSCFLGFLNWSYQMVHVHICRNFVCSQVHHCGCNYSNSG